MAAERLRRVCLFLSCFEPLRPCDWIGHQSRARFRNGEDFIPRYLALKAEAWRPEGPPFHIWLTSPALETLDVIFAMNLGWAESRQDCFGVRALVLRAKHPGKVTFPVAKCISNAAAMTFSRRNVLDVHPCVLMSTVYTAIASTGLQ